MDKILDSQTFKESSNLKRFLEFVVTETIFGKGSQLKQYTIAVNAFDRDANFDSQKDPIVRIQAGRLRQLLTFFYLNEGSNDPIIIEIPKGTYIPQFSSVQRLSSSKNSSIPHNPPIIKVYPFLNLSSSQENKYIAEGFTEELIANLSFFKNIVTVRASHDYKKAIELDIKHLKSQSTHVFYLKGTIRFTSSKIKVIVTLFDEVNNHTVWSMDFLEPYQIEGIIEIQEKVAEKVATSVADVYGGAIVKQIQSDPQMNSYKDLEQFNIISLLYQFERNPNSVEHDKIYNIFQEAVKKYPDFGPGWSALANLTINNYVLGYTPEGSKLLNEGLMYARRGVELAPNHQLVRTLYGYSFLIDNKLEDCLIQMEYARSLNPKSAFFIGSIGFISCLAGDWKNGMENLTTSFLLNPDYPSWYHISTTLYYLKEKDFEKALVESLKIDLPLIFWDNALKSVCYAYNNNLPKAEMYLIQINEFMPDFFNRPIYYLKKFIKFDDILETVVEGITKAGFEEEILVNKS